MNAFLTATAFVVLIAAAAYVIHRLNLQHADRIAAYRYSTPRPGRRGRCAPQPHLAPRTKGDHPDGRPTGHPAARLNRRLSPRRRVPGAYTQALGSARSGRDP
ncbi:hypothetical protein [Streptomyces ossamyceticus]|uniref:hypothetical protein n=1 Tax=Streptomyces ossamyceticus TaxID=249581 RepID=UPI003418B55B